MQSNDYIKERRYRQKSFFGDDEFLIEEGSERMNKKRNLHSNQASKDSATSEVRTVKETYGANVKIDIKSPRSIRIGKKRKRLSVSLDKNTLVLIGVILGVIGSAICVEYVHKNSFLQAVFIGLTAIFFGVLVALAVKLVRDVKIGINKSDREE